MTKKKKNLYQQIAIFIITLSYGIIIGIVDAVQKAYQTAFKDDAK